MAGEKDSFSLNESQTTKTSFKINKVPTNADALTLANQGAFGAGEFVITPQDADDRDFFLLTHPIGSYYITEESISPIDSYGGGWAQIKGRFLLGAGANDANTTTTYGSLSASAINRTTIGEMGGEVTHKLTISEIPSHNHTVAAYNSGFDSYSDSTKTGNTSNSTSFNTGSKGGDGAHNNIPPYRVVYIWKRIS